MLSHILKCPIFDVTFKYTIYVGISSFVPQKLYPTAKIIWATYNVPFVSLSFYGNLSFVGRHCLRGLFLYTIRIEKDPDKKKYKCRQMKQICKCVKERERILSFPIQEKFMSLLQGYPCCSQCCFMLFLTRVIIHGFCQCCCCLTWAEIVFIIYRGSTYYTRAFFVGIDSVGGLGSVDGWWMDG